jgi:hypothetical protein
MELQRFDHSSLEKPHIMPHAHRAQPHIKIAEADPEKTHPSPQHVATI